jgi:hypothetical protein
MIITEKYKHDSHRDLDKHIKRKERRGYKLKSCKTRDIFWTFSIYLKESTLVWKN